MVAEVEMLERWVVALQPAGDPATGEVEVRLAYIDRVEEALDAGRLDDAVAPGERTSNGIIQWVARQLVDLERRCHDRVMRTAEGIYVPRGY